MRPGGPPRRSHGKMGFANMAKTIGAKWNAIDPATKAHYERLASREKLRYKKAVAEWRKKVRALKRQHEMAAVAAGLPQENQEEQDSDSDLSSSRSADHGAGGPNKNAEEGAEQYAYHPDEANQNGFFQDQEAHVHQQGMMGFRHYPHQHQEHVLRAPLQQPEGNLQNHHVRRGLQQEPGIMAQFQFHQELEARHQQEVIDVLEPLQHPPLQHQPGDAGHNNNLDILAENLGDEGVASMINLFQGQFWSSALIYIMLHASPMERTS